MSNVARLRPQKVEIPGYLPADLMESLASFNQRLEGWGLSPDVQAQVAASLVQTYVMQDLARDLMLTLPEVLKK